MKKTALSSKKRIAEQKTFSSAIKSLRSRLGKTQEVMARLVGITLRGYLAWERAEAEPRGRHLLRLIQVCPDAEARASLGLEIYPPTVEGAAANVSKPISGENMERISHRETAHRGIELLFEHALEGSNLASEHLARFARELLRTAGDTDQVPRIPDRPRPAVKAEKRQKNRS
jgi:DNA-binding transcriptional regulator YiaG